MRVLVLGAYGLIGSYVIARLHAEGHEIVGLGRDVASARRRFPYARWIATDLGRLRTPGEWDEPLTGIEAVVNCAGALQDSPRDNLRAVHVHACAALYAACAARGVRRVIHVSAAGVAPGRGTAFNDTKLAAETGLKALDLDWVILRPGLVLAPAAYGGTALLRGIASFPWVMPVDRPDAIVQAVWVDDVALAVSRALAPDAPSRLSLDVVYDEPTTLGEILVALRAWLGLAPAPLLRVPSATVARIADAIAALGWRPPLRSTTVAQLSGGVTGDPAPLLRRLGIRPLRLAEFLARWPSGVQERWFARLYFLKPAALAGLIIFWLASGVIGVTGGFHGAVAILTAAGVAPRAAQLIVIAGAICDITLALTACFRRGAPWALKGMLAVCAAYLVGGSALRPDLWLDPLGPFVKIIPVMLLALMTLAVLDER